MQELLKIQQLVANGGLKIPLATAESYPLACGQPGRIHISRIATNWLNSPCIGLPFLPASKLFSSKEFSFILYLTVEHTSWFVLPNNPFSIFVLAGNQTFHLPLRPAPLPAWCAKIFTSRFRATVTG
jgi:hypothetical protein